MMKNFIVKKVRCFSDIFILSVITFVSCQQLQSQTKNPSAKNAIVYVCLPCGQACDEIVSDAPGVCSICHMKLVDKSTVRFKTISPAEMNAYVQQHPDVVLLDVRTKEEFEGKADPNYPTLKNAINIPVQELEGRLASIAYLKKKKIIVYCSHAHRSAVASYMLTQNGFNDVTNMSGGVSTIKPEELIK